MLDPQFLPFPVLETDRLLLRRVEPADAKDVLELRGDVEAMKYVHKPPAKTIDDAIAFIAKVESALQLNEGIGWGIILKESNKLIGHLGFHRISKEHFRAEIGYMISPAYWNKGLISEAIAPVIDYGFKTMKLHSIEAKINPDNSASRAVLKKQAFEKEAYFKEDFFYDGVFTDTEVYSLINK